MLEKSIKAIIAVFMIGGFFLNTEISVLANEIEDEKSLTHTVTLKDEEGNIIDTVAVDHAYRMTKPQDPTKAGHDFIGWYQEGWSISFGFTYETIMKDTTLIARFEKNNSIMHTVNFHSDNGRDDEIQEIEHGFLVKKPADPMKPGYKFIGWYQEGGGNPFWLCL